MTRGKPTNLSAIEYERAMHPHDLAIDFHGNRVVSGCEVKASEQPGFTVSVAPGVANINGRDVKVQEAGCIYRPSAVHRRIPARAIKHMGWLAGQRDSISILMTTRLRSLGISNLRTWIS
jgi:hypothetical protein